MLCTRCESLFVDSKVELEPQGRWVSLSKPLSSQMCARCGAILPLQNSAEAMLSKLSQLSRFGLGADDRPILTSLVGGK